jgi:methyl-accepting chemotaxis protein
MTKRVLEISISVLAIACVIALIIGFFSLKPFYNSGLKIMSDSHEVLQNSKLLINELREGVAETKKTSDEFAKMLKSSGFLFKEMTEAIGEANETPKEFVKLIKEIRLLAEEVKDTVSEAKKSQIEMAKSADRTRDILYELAIASFILALSEERIISNVEADQMILQSIETIEGRSERFGKLANSIIDFKRAKE